MDLNFNSQLATNYKSASQIIRVLSEDWVNRHGFCPKCGQEPLQDFANNRPVADFHCTHCLEQFELKSKKSKLSMIINDGAYKTMIERISSEHNPNFFFLTYSHLKHSTQFTVNNFLVIPKHFFTPSIIIKRPPLPLSARRAGWVGCNIDLRRVPEPGKVFIIKDRELIHKEKVTTQFGKTTFLRQQTAHSRGWTLEVMHCVGKLPNRFSLSDAYSFSDYLKTIYPNNNNIKAKIRQQLQILRDEGLIEFLGSGQYRKLG